MISLDQMVSVRYMVDDVQASIDFYTRHFGFEERTSFPPASPTSPKAPFDCC